MNLLSQPAVILGNLVGLVFAVIGVAARHYVRSRLREAGVSLTSWFLIEDDLYYTELYLKMARTHHLPKWPAVAAPLGLFLWFLAMSLPFVLNR